LPRENSFKVLGMSEAGNAMRDLEKQAKVSLVIDGAEQLS